MNVTVTDRTIIAVRLPLDIDDIETLYRFADKHKPIGTEMFIGQDGKWFLIEAMKKTGD